MYGVPSAGYVPVHEDDLHKTGVRGRKTYFFWTVIVILSVLALVNFIILIVVCSVLRIGLGMKHIELVNGHSLIKFYGTTDLGVIFKRDGLLEGFKDEPFIVIGKGGQILVDIIPPQQGARKRVLTLDINEVLFQNIQSFQVVHPKTGNNIFSTHNPYFSVPYGVRHLYAEHVTTSRISSPVNQSLFLKSDSMIIFKGNEGTRMEGKHISWSADQFLFLKSVNGSIILNGTKGVTMDTKQIPFATASSNTSTVSQYKICVCMPSGKLFRVKVNPGHSSKAACSKGNLLLHSDPCNTV